VEDFPTDAVSAILEYYSDKKLHHKCGSIDLTTCEEVYSALDSETYKHVFCVQVICFGVLLLFSLFSCYHVFLALPLESWLRRIWLMSDLPSDCV